MGDKKDINITSPDVKYSMDYRTRMAYHKSVTEECGLYAWEW